MRLRRRQLLVGSAALLAWPGFALAQAKPRHIGLLHVGDDHMPPSLKAMPEAMTGLGHRGGLHGRYGVRNEVDERAALAAARDLVKQRVDLIIAFDQEACGLARVATDLIPI